MSIKDRILDVYAANEALEKAGASHRLVLPQSGPVEAVLMSNPTSLREALESAIKVAAEAHAEWDADNDPRVGKLLMALAGWRKGYRKDIDAIHETLEAARTPQSTRVCPKCKGRATKIVNANTGVTECQQCGHEWR